MTTSLRVTTETTASQSTDHARGRIKLPTPQTGRPAGEGKYKIYRIMLERLESGWKDIHE
jgi:hypothetical protein